MGTTRSPNFFLNGGSGFCEHYAASFASLMRIAGIPSRLVIGYHGGEYNRLGNYVLVRQLGRARVGGSVVERRGLGAR